MRKWTLPAAAALGLAALSVTGLQAQGNIAAAIDTSEVEAGTYTADANHSMVNWNVNHLGFNDYFGIFGDVSGTLELDPENLEAAKVDVTIPISSVIVPSEGLKAHLLKPAGEDGKPDFFGADPEAAHFVSTKVELTGETTAVITGDLTLNGVTKPVAIQAILSGVGTNGMSQKKTIGFHGRATINRSDFGLDFGIPFGISDNVGLMITVAFEK